MTVSTSVFSKTTVAGSWKAEVLLKAIVLQSTGTHQTHNKNTSGGEEYEEESGLH